MQALAGISFVLLLLVSWVAGVRLLLLYRRTGARPELYLGLATLLLVGTGYPLSLVAQSEGVPLVTAKVLQCVSNLSIDTGLGLVFLFTWQVFRPKARWAATLTGIGAGFLVLHLVAVAIVLHGLESMSGAMQATARWAALDMLTGTVGYAWTAAESIRYHRILRRRLPLGLADPVVVNRFWLWSGMAIAIAIGLVANGTFLLAGVDVTKSPLALTISSSAGITQAVLLYLAFVPPEAYRRWLQAPQLTAQVEPPHGVG